MKQLQLGLISYPELADWFGITYGSFRNSSQKKFTLLKDFCEYEKVKGGIKVTKIYIEEFVKKPSITDCAFVVNEIHSKESPLNSICGIGKLIEEYHKGELSENQGLYQARRILNLLFGAFHGKNMETNGLLGGRKKIWAAKLPGTNKYRFLTPEEEESFDNLIAHNLSTKETVQEVKTLAQVEKEDRSEAQNQFIEDFFNSVIGEMAEKHHIWIVKVQIYEFLRNFNMTNSERQILKSILEEMRKQGYQVPDLL